MIQDMTSGDHKKQIFFFAIPLLIGNLFQQLYGMVDAIIVGRFVNVEALAAVGSTGAISFLVIGFVQGATTGFSIVTAQRFGAGDQKGVKYSVITSTMLCVILTVILTVLSVATAEPLLRLMNTPDDIIDDAARYIIIIYAGIFATMFYNMIAGILRALGDSKTPLYFLVFSSIVNVVLDLLFIIYFHMGVAGAGYATVLSQLISAILCTVYSVKRYEILKFGHRELRWDSHSAISHLRIGIPMALQFSVTAIGVMVLQSALNVFGSTVIAAFTAASKVEALVTQPFVALGMTMATFCGQNLGAGKFDRIRIGMRDCIRMCMITCVISALFSIFCGKYFTMMFVSGNKIEVIQSAQLYLNIVAVSYPLLGLLFVYRNALQGMGEALIPMLGGVGELAARVIVCMTLPELLGYTGVCLAAPAAWVAADIFLFPKYVSIIKKWKREGKIS